MANLTVWKFDTSDGAENALKKLALFVLSGASTEDKVREAFAGVNMELIQSNLTREQEAELREHFG